MDRFEERLGYYLTLTSLLAEADLQLQVDAKDAGSALYAERLEDLCRAMSTAMAASGAIAARIQRQWAQDRGPTPTHAPGLGQH